MYDAIPIVVQQSKNMRILVIEDDSDTAAYMVKGLRESGYVVDHAGDGREGMVQAMAGGHDALIIDRMLPHVDGLSIIQAIRASGIKTPVLILSALAQVDDRVKGLKAGGDDYLTKPYAFSELLARIEVLLRRTGGPQVETKLRIADLEMDLLQRRVFRQGKEIDIQPREFLLLEYLVRNAGNVVTRTMLLEQVWGYHFDPQTNVIDVHISRLRQKVDKEFDKALIHTIRGAGYILKAPE